MRMRGAMLAAAVGLIVAGPPRSAAAQSAEGSLSLRLEPGVVLSDGSAEVPFQLLDRQGLPFPLKSAELRLDVDGRPVRPELMTYDGARRTAVFALVDPSAFRGSPDAWAQELTAFVSGGVGDERALLGLARVPEVWTDVGGVAPPPTELADRLAGSGEFALWDGILLALDRLSEPGPPLPERRILIVVSNGLEARESRHPVATCVDAADSARVSVWCVTPDAPVEAEGIGVDRLRVLAERTGGRVFVPGPGEGPARFRDLVAGVRATQGLRLATLPGPAPLNLTLTPGVAAARPVSGVLRPRQALGLSGGGPFPWIPLLAGVAAAGLGGGLLLRQSAPIGRLQRRDTGESVPVTRRGLTIGGAQGNGLVISDSRVSRNHAALRMEEGRVTLVDLRSSNGTSVNGRPIRSAVLRDGDRIVLADRVEMIWRSGFRFGRGG